MSSESDDEDELLQSALREQAQRESSYTTASSAIPSKHVKNLVQPPRKPAAPSSTAKFTTYQRSKPNKTVAEDDDSEIELLSISSGDEDANRKSGDKSSTVRKVVDREWDGKEPNCWKRVDEAELARRVREMKETKSAHPAQKSDEKPVGFGKKGLSLAGGSECTDPLGLGIIDDKSLRLISDSSDCSPSKSGRNKVREGNRDRLMYLSEKFDAKLFLSCIHQNTSASDLEAGALALKADFKGRTQQRKRLVKDNFDCFISCKTTIDDIESKLKQIEESTEDSGTSHLFHCIHEVSSLAGRAFGSLFERQAQAEKIRSVQGMLQRFRTLFNLPNTIRVSIRKGEYDLAVREYKKAKSVALPSHVNILKRVLEEVEKVIHEFKGMLYKSMEDPCMDLTSLETTVRLLWELEPESDPTRHYLSVKNKRIRSLLEKCSSDHEARMEKLHNEMREKANLEAMWKLIQKPQTNTSDDISSESLMDSNQIDIPTDKADVLKERCIEELTAVLICHLPSFWKVALSVSSEKVQMISSDANFNTVSNKSEVRGEHWRHESHFLDDVTGMVENTASLYGLKVLDMFRGFDGTSVTWTCMHNALQHVSKVCMTLEQKDSAPLNTVLTLRTLYVEIVKIYILKICSWMRSSTEALSNAETWIPVSVLERKKSPYTISSLPLEFRSVVVSAMDEIIVVYKSLRDIKKSDEMQMQLNDIRQSVKLAFFNCFLDFAGNLELLASDLTKKKSVGNGMQLPMGYSHEMEVNFSPDNAGSSIDPYQQLLITMSNIGYCKDELATELHSKYKKIWVSSSLEMGETNVLQDLVASFSDLEAKILDQYTFAKANMVRTAALNYLLNSDAQWGAAPAVKGVRDAAVELLHILVSIHAEVFSGAKPLLDRTLGILVEGLIDMFLSIFHEHKDKELQILDANGFCQLMLELDYFETILNPYITPDARESLKSLQGVLLEKATENVSEIIEKPGHRRRLTRGSEDSLGEDRQQGLNMSPDDLIAIAQQCSSELLQVELERTRINTACFAESIPLDSFPESAKSSYTLKNNISV